MAILLSAVFGLAPRQIVFRSEVNFVQVYVSVTSDNHPIVGLKAADFDLADNGERQNILVLDHENMPLDITLVIDASESVNGLLLDGLLKAVNQIRASLHPEDRVSLVTFNERIVEHRAMIPAPSLGFLTIHGASGLTALNDAIAVTINAALLPNRRQMAIVFTDGIDTVSFLDESSVLGVAQRSNMPVFVITSKSRGRSGSRLLNQLVEASGGTIQEAQTNTRGSDMNSLGASFMRALDNFRDSYILRYTFEGTAKPGWHNLAVRVVKPRNTFKVRARNGYFAR